MLTVDRLRIMVVVLGDVLHHVEREGNCPGWGMSGGTCLGGICPGEMFGSPFEIIIMKFLWERNVVKKLRMISKMAAFRCTAASGW